jgi:tetratricopeptide (TPR) repeat protein
VEAFRRAVKVRPDYAEAWAYLGEARQHLDQDGFPDLQRALSIDGKSLSAQTFLALYWQRKAQFDLAIFHLNAALEIEPDNPALHAELGGALALSGDLVAAEKQYTLAVKVAPRDPQYWRALADFTIKYEVKLRELGLPAASQAVTLNPKDPASLDVMAQVQFLLGDLQKSRIFLERAVEADPSYAPAHLHMALVHLETGETYLAYQELTKSEFLSLPGSPTSDHARRLLDQLFP